MGQKVKAEGRLVEFYSVRAPYAHVGIYDVGYGRLLYKVIEPPLSEEEREIIERLKNYLIEDKAVDLKVLLEEENVEEFLKERLRRIVKKYKVRVPEKAYGKIEYYVLRDVWGYGKIDVMVKDVNIEDVSCDGVGIPVYVWHRKYESLPTNVVFESEEELDSFIVRLAYKAGKQISIASPIVEGSLPEGFRVHLTLREISRRGSTFTIRKFRETPYTIIDLIDFGTISPLLAAYLWFLVDEKRNIMIGGATAAGKTTTLNAIAMFIRPEAKIVTIEEVPEIKLPHENWISLVTRPAVDSWVRDISLFDLLKSALRMRPDYIIVGEVRGEEAYTLFQSIATGHAGMCTIHAENVQYAIRRLETKPMNIPRILIPMMNVYIQIVRTRFQDRIVRRITEVHEIVGIDPDTGEIILNKVFSWNPLKDTIERVGESVLLRNIAEQKAVTLRQIEEEIERRHKVIKYMVRRNLRNFDEVSSLIREYYLNPSEVEYKIMLGVG